jgi:hypothetical protein
MGLSKTITIHPPVAIHCDKSMLLVVLEGRRRLAVTGVRRPFPAFVTLKLLSLLPPLRLQLLLVDASEHPP